MNCEFIKYLFAVSNSLVVLGAPLTPSHVGCVTRKCVSTVSIFDDPAFLEKALNDAEIVFTVLMDIDPAEDVLLVFRERVEAGGCVGGDQSH